MKIISILVMLILLVSCQKYQLSVAGGIGSGQYDKDAVVDIAANMPEEGTRFYRWEGDFDLIADRYEANTKINLNRETVNISAVFVDENKVNQLTILGGTGSGPYHPGDIVKISAIEPDNGTEFWSWEGDLSLEDLNISGDDVFKKYIQIRMPDQDIHIQAKFEFLYNLNIVNGSGSGNYPEGHNIRIKANTPPIGSIFAEWNTTFDLGDDRNKAEITILMPRENIELEAVFDEIPAYKLEVIGGEGSGDYKPGASVKISAPAEKGDLVFKKWTSDVYGVLKNIFYREQTIVMPFKDVTLKANYIEKVVEPTPTPIPTPNGTLKLMMIGDSITHASGGTGDVRCELWQRLQGLNVKFNFVGDMNGFNGGGGTANCDNDHEAHWGWKADQILGIINGSASRHAPDVAVIHLGTNDIRGGQSNTSTVNEISSIIDYLRRYNYNVAVFVAGIIPNYKDNTHSQTADLNAKLKAFAPGKSISGSPVFYVDQNTGFYASDLADKIHPNSSGARKMATNWERAIKSYLGY